MLSYLSAMLPGGAQAEDAGATNQHANKPVTANEKQDEELRILTELRQKRGGENAGCEYLAIICESLDRHIVHRVTIFFEELAAHVHHVYVILHVSSGGDASDCAVLTKLFNKFAAGPDHRITMCVPEIAMSSGAQLTMCGTELVMGKYAHLTPFDDQICSISVKNVKRITQSLTAKQQQRFTLSEHDTILQAKYLRKITKQELKRCLKLQGCSNQTAKRVEALFLNHSLYHSYPIDIDMVRKTGLHVMELDDPDVWSAYKELYQLWVGEDST